MLTPDLVMIADIVGIIAFSLSGFLVGVRHHLDLLGIFIASFLTALGGGIVRDVILDRTPFAFDHTYPALSTFITLALAFGLRLYRWHDLERQWLFVISDTIGLVAFSLTGALLALQADLNAFGVILLSFLTAVGGGVLRDTMINQVPSVLISDFYGSITLIVSIFLLIIHAMGWLSSGVILFIALSAIVLRLLAYGRGWHLMTLESSV